MLGGVLMGFGALIAVFGLLGQTGLPTWLAVLLALVVFAVGALLTHRRQRRDEREAQWAVTRSYLDR